MLVVLIYTLASNVYKPISYEVPTLQNTSINIQYVTITDCLTYQHIAENQNTVSTCQISNLNLLAQLTSIFFACSKIKSS